MTSTYRHRQIGSMTIGGLVFGLLVAGVVSFRIFTAAAPIPLAAAIIIPVIDIVLLIALILFATLTVSIGGHTVEVAFGPGWIRRRIPMDQIVSSEIVRTPWYYGWGLRYTPRGPLWNVSGVQAVLLRLTNGKTFQIGTDEPTTLQHAIDVARLANAPQA